MNTSPYLLLALALLLVACSKDSPVGPSTTPPPAATTTVVINTSGGTVALNGFVMNVPASAFVRAETLKVTQETYSGTFGSHNVTDQFRLEGLPGDFPGKINLSLKCTRTPSASLTIGIGTEGAEIARGNSRILYSLRRAVLDSGYLKLPLSADSMSATLSKSAGISDDIREVARFFTGFDQMTDRLSDQGHFLVTYPLSSEAMAVQIGMDLEDAYTWFSQMRFENQTYSKVKWPIKVYIQWSKNFEVNNLVESTIYSKDLQPTDVPVVAIGCNENEWDHGPAEFRKWLFAHYSHLFSAVHDAFFRDPNFKDRLTSEAPRIWPYYAIGTWAGAEAHLPGYDSLPPLLAGRKLTPLWGLTPPAGDKPTYHGHGMAPLMKYIADEFGRSTLANLYDAVRTSGKTNAIDMFLGYLSPPEYDWWPDFIGQYLSGKIYGVPADTFLLDLQSGSGKRDFDIKGKNDTLKYFTAQYRDLSARLYRVNLRYPEISPDAMITFKVGPPSLNLNYVHVIVFGLKDHKFEYWEKANTVNVAKLRDLTSAGYDIVAAVVNSSNEPPYTGSMAIDLDVKVAEVTLTRACIKVRALGTTEYYDGSTSKGGFVLYNSASEFREGTFLDNHFTTTWNEVSTVRNNGSWDFTVDFSQNPPVLTYFRAIESTASGTETETWRVEASSTCGILGAKNQYGSYEFTVRGLNVASHIRPIENRLENSATNYWWQLIATDFDDNSYITVILQ